MSKWAQGEYIPKNPEKYVGSAKIKYRSSWECNFMMFLDNHPGVLQWSSESVRIPYFNPVKGRQSLYVPDFLVVYIDKNGRQHAELIEIKPSKETTMEHARSTRDKIMVAINMAKWKAATVWARQHGIHFRLVTERELFHQGTRK
jgi:hypothetical protein